jgi:hypothetical protein
MMTTICQIQEESKVCQQMDLGLLQDVLPSALIEELLETYQMWETRERKLNMVVLTYWLIALHLYPHLSMRAVYAKLVSGQRAWRDDVPQQIPAKSAVSYRREHLGSELVEELFGQCAGPKATEQTPGAFWPSMGRSSRCPIRRAIGSPSATALMMRSRRVPFRKPAWCCWWNVGRI